ncbi:lysM domain receptor-like kinase 4 [Cicer arietinum]|uniref:LysM domain receptor-like kinase 4 n=1 Tax=Cicer arietinum TaxID=3827 RepID=A0A1S2Y633_CICAR|nr:lysM domain receptor-like kinase 4 [Cicer arietinum]
MNHHVCNLIFFTLIILLSSKTKAQQNYSGNSILGCNNNDEKGPSPAFLYTCNGLNKSCMAFVIFKSKPSYNSISTISNFLSLNPKELARINSVNLFAVFPPGKEVIVPVNCSCLTNDYYQAETKYILGPNSTYLTVANDTFQGLSTCDSLMRVNRYGELDLHQGMELHVPLRCACPTYHQKTNGIKYLLTYSVNWGDNISYIATRFNVAVGNLLDANGFSTQTEMLYPFTTVLIPLQSEPVSSTTIVVNDPPTMTPSTGRSFKKCKSKKKVLIIAIATSVLVLCVILFLLFLFLFLLRKRSGSFFNRGNRVKNKIGISSEEIRGKIAIIEHISKVYSFEEITEATENFSSKNRINGSLFRGEFGNGKEVLAVKRMRGDASKEVNLLKKINHFNLIKLQGYCENNDCHYLVYEYMENGSLREWLSKNSSIEHQSLAKRIQIALDIANGLQYLHNFTEPCYVHKDINSGNILLNKDLRAKIAKLALAEESKIMITSDCPKSYVVGSVSYLAPEYLYAGVVSTKMDVYAFGVVLLELITGKDSITLQDGREVMLYEIIENIVDNDNEEEKVSLFIDPCLIGSCRKACALQLVKLSLACLIQEPEKRPNVEEVVSSLLKIQANDMQQRISPTINKSLSLER